jgi:hypothetical protein
MKMLAAFAISVTALTVGLWALQDEDPKAKTRITRRDARYSDPTEKNRPISRMGDGHTRRTVQEFLDTHGHDKMTADGKSLLTPEAKAAIRAKLSDEHAARRKTVVCDSTVILFGRVKNARGYITADDTAIYTVYNFIVTEVYRSPDTLPISPGSQIEVTAPGGVAKTGNGKNVSVESPGYPWLALEWNHILALKYDPEADDYYVFNPIGLYIVSPDKRIRRGDSVNEFLVRQAYLAREPATLETIVAEIKSTTCPQ